jgi:uncharacterized membrane protein SpoIIM required for sporulation
VFWRYGIELHVEHKAPWRCEMNFALRFAMIFIGLDITAALPLVVLGHEGYHTFFTAGSNLIGPSSTDFTFYSLLPTKAVINHNISVTTTCFLLGLFFRQLGSIIVISYNALAWGVALEASMMAVATIEPIWILIAPLALLPHLSFEVLGFCMAAVAGTQLHWIIRTTA